MIKFILFTAFFTLSLPSVAQYTPDQVHAAVKQAGGIERFLAEVARQAAQSLPQMANRDVQIQSVSVAGRRLAYTAVLVNVENKLGQDVEAMQRKSDSDFVCKSPILGIAISHYSAEVTYYYTARNNDFLYQHTFSRKSCEGRNTSSSVSYTSEPPSEVDFLLLMSPPHASEAADYNRILQVHPDAIEISKSNIFRSWALENPKTWASIKSHDTDGLITVFYDFKSIM